MECLWPCEQWAPCRVEARIEAVRRRLHHGAFPYPLLHDKDSGSVPGDNTLLHNLLRVPDQQRSGRSYALDTSRVQTCPEEHHTGEVPL
ncbi:hypothetical protein [Streptomyces spiralis]|uniref:hypothetical protein n=1 Tax=Streptomyces spiralis TaxID=66376 RepID=UPI0036CC2DA6